MFEQGIVWLRGWPVPSRLRVCRDVRNPADEMQQGVLRQRSGACRASCDRFRDPQGGDEIFPPQRQQTLPH